MWGAYQKIIACYAEPDRRKARGMTQRVFVQWNCGRLSIVFQSS